EVVDTGIGIPADLLPKIFDLFVQGGRGLDRAQGGLGVGLTLVRALTVMHGGTVEATSDGPGRGAMFTVRLPRVRPTLTPAEPRSAKGPGTAHRRILVIEDNEDAREMLKVWLARMGHKVHDTAYGAAGVDMASVLEPDVVLIDVGLPVLD